VKVFKKALAEREEVYEVWRSNPNRVKGDRLWEVYAKKHRLAGKISDASYSRFVEVNLDPDLP
jgi:hypothetical protein